MHFVVDIHSPQRINTSGFDMSFIPKPSSNVNTTQTIYFISSSQRKTLILHFGNVYVEHCSLQLGFTVIFLGFAAWLYEINQVHVQIF